VANRLLDLRALSDRRKEATGRIDVCALTAISQATLGRVALIQFGRRGRNNPDYIRTQ
jgi:hypothetical protein